MNLADWISEVRQILRDNQNNPRWTDETIIQAFRYGVIDFFKKTKLNRSTEYVDLVNYVSRYTLDPKFQSLLSAKWAGEAVPIYTAEQMDELTGRDDWINDTGTEVKAIIVGGPTKNRITVWPKPVDVENANPYVNTEQDFFENTDLIFQAADNFAVGTAYVLTIEPNLTVTYALHPELPALNLDATGQANFEIPFDEDYVSAIENFAVARLYEYRTDRQSEQIKRRAFAKYEKAVAEGISEFNSSYGRVKRLPKYRGY